MKQTTDYRTPEDLLALALQKIEHVAHELIRARSEDRIRLITNDELAKKLGVSRRALYDYRREGILVYSVIKGRIYYEPKMVEEMLRRHRVRITLRSRKRSK